MDKNKELEQKLKEFIDNFQLNTPELNNLEPKKKVYIDKILRLFIKNICNSDCCEGCMYIVIPDKLGEFKNFVETLLFNEKIDTLKNIFLFLNKNLENKSVQIVKKIKNNQYNILDIVKYITNNKKTYISNGKYIIKINLDTTLKPLENFELDTLQVIMLKIKNDKQQKNIKRQVSLIDNTIHVNLSDWWYSSAYLESRLGIDNPSPIAEYTDLDGSRVTGYSPHFSAPFTSFQKSDQSLFFESFNDFQNIIQEIRKTLK